MPRFTTSSTTYGAFYAQPQAPSAGVKKPTAAIDNPYANSLTGIDAVLADRVSRSSACTVCRCEVKATFS